MSYLDRLLQGPTGRRIHRHYGIGCVGFDVSVAANRKDGVTWASGAIINMVARAGADGVVGRKDYVVHVFRWRRGKCAVQQASDLVNYRLSSGQTARPTLCVVPVVRLNAFPRPAPVRGRL